MWKIRLGYVRLCGGEVGLVWVRLSYVRLA